MFQRCASACIATKWMQLAQGPGLIRRGGVEEKGPSSGDADRPAVWTHTVSSANGLSTFCWMATRFAARGAVMLVAVIRQGGVGKTKRRHCCCGGYSTRSRCRAGCRCRSVELPGDGARAGDRSDRRPLRDSMRMRRPPSSSPRQNGSR